MDVWERTHTGMKVDPRSHVQPQRRFECICLESAPPGVGQRVPLSAKPGILHWVVGVVAELESEAKARC